MAQTADGLSLFDLVHLADAAEISNPESEPDRYWLKGEELIRDKPWMGKATCFIVVTSAARGGSIKMPFKSAIPVTSSAWTAPVTGSATISCKQADVLGLLRRYTLVEGEGKKPAAVFREDLEREIATVAAICDEASITNPDGTSTGGELAAKVSDRVRRRWGITVNLSFELDFRREIRRSKFEVKARVRLRDPVKEFPVNAIVELAAEPISMLRAVAARGHDEEIRESFEELLKDFYQKITMDQLVDPAKRDACLMPLRDEVEQCGRTFGRKARLVETVEDPPPLPGNTHEKVNVALTERLIHGEPEPIAINMSATLRLTSSSTLLRAMEPRPGRSFNQEFESIARSTFGPLADGWTAHDYKLANRPILEDELRRQLTAPAQGFGYAVVAIAITTSLDPESAEISPTAALLRDNFRTTIPDVTVDIEVTVKLTFDPGQRHRKTVRDLLDPYADEIRELLGQAVAKLPPSEVYLHWLVPWTGSDALHKVLKGHIEEKFRKVAHGVDVDIRLHGHVELLQMRDRVLRTPLRMERIPLNRENVPGEITVDLHAPVIGIAEEAWGEMTKLLAVGQTWDPVREVEGDLVRIIQKSFRMVVESTVQQRVSKKSVIADLAASISREVLTNYQIGIRPDIVAYSSREVIAFFELQAKAREKRVRDFLDLSDKLEGLIHKKKLERLQLIGDGHGAMARTKEIQGTIESLENELLQGKKQTDVYRREHQDALYFVQLLTVPADEPSTPADPDESTTAGSSSGKVKKDESAGAPPADEEN